MNQNMNQERRVRVSRRPVKAVGACMMRGHADGDHKVVVEIDVNGWISRLCVVHARDLKDQLRELL